MRAAALVLALVASCSQEPPPPQVISQVGAFELVERSGSKVTNKDLAGRPWVASFLFTRCTGPCPRVAGTLRELQARLGKSSARIVTFSVDPEWDTPQVLQRYAAEVGADPKRWLFLTGDEKAIHELSRKGFLSAAERAPPGAAPIGEQVSHSTRLVAVDKRGGVRGYFAGESDEDLGRLIALLAVLEAEQGLKLPLLNACLNATSGVLLLAGLGAIKARRRELHERLMLAALAVSSAFLASYLYYHLVVERRTGPTRFHGVGLVRTAYLTMLATHVVLAVTVVPLALRTAFLARRGRFETHKRWAKVTFPIWMYVSVTGVLVYLTLYVWNPPVE